MLRPLFSTNFFRPPFHNFCWSVTSAASGKPITNTKSKKCTARISEWKDGNTTLSAHFSCAPLFGRKRDTSPLALSSGRCDAINRKIWNCAPSGGTKPIRQLSVSARRKVDFPTVGRGMKPKVLSFWQKGVSAEPWKIYYDRLEIRQH